MERAETTAGNGFGHPRIASRIPNVKNNLCTMRLGEYDSVVDLVEQTELLQDAGAVSQAETPVSASNTLVVCDENTRRYVDTAFGTVGNGANPESPEEDPVVISLTPGEQSKTWTSVERIVSAAIDRGLGRDARFFAVGGGVVCDITAFAASVYMRGCGLVLVPTTLLAMVDAAIGGKTGIDHRSLKNIVGTFYPAREVRICPATLHTLSQREYRSGLAEVIKHAMLGDSVLFNTLRNDRERILSRDEYLLRDLVPQAAMVKVRVVEQDFREGGLRMHLNLGHTFGHALETITGFKTYTHGEAVAWGIATALRAGVNLRVTDPEYAATVCELLSSYGYNLSISDVSVGDLAEAMQHDKKNTGGRVRLILQEELGRTKTHAVPKSELTLLLDQAVTRAGQ